MIASLAGAAPSRAATLGLSMLAIQASIGALNDAVDAPLDRSAKPWKPVARGIVPASWAVVAAVVLGGAGLLVTLASSVGAAAVLAAGLGLGWAYDLRLSRTSWSWLPLALALPVVPLHAWIGATGSIPAGLALLVPLAVLAGATLALANGLVDVERDATVGRAAIAVRLGRARTWLVHAGLLAGVAVAAILLMPSLLGGPAGAGPLRTLQVGAAAMGCLLLATGAAALGSRRAGIRERGWELEAVGVAAIAIAWLAGTAAQQGGGA